MSLNGPSQGSLFYRSPTYKCTLFWTIFQKFIKPYYRAYASLQFLAHPAGNFQPSPYPLHCVWKFAVQVSNGNTCTSRLSQELCYNSQSLYRLHKVSRKAWRDVVWFGRSSEPSPRDEKVSNLSWCNRTIVFFFVGRELAIM